MLKSFFKVLEIAGELFGVLEFVQCGSKKKGGGESKNIILWFL